MIRTFHQNLSKNNKQTKRTTIVNRSRDKVAIKIRTHANCNQKVSFVKGITNAIGNLIVNTMQHASSVAQNEQALPESRTNGPALESTNKAKTI